MVVVCWASPASPELCLPCPQAPWPWLLDKWEAEQLDPGGTVFRVPAFLSEEEMRHVLMDVRPRLNFTDDSPTHRQAILCGAGLADSPLTKRHMMAADYAVNYSPKQQADSVLLAIEHRISELTSIPFHDVRVRSG